MSQTSQDPQIPEPLLPASLPVAESEIVAKPFYDRERAKNLIVIRDQIYYRDVTDNSDPQSFTVGWSYEIDSKEQPWIRRCIAEDTTWKPLDLGWLKNQCGLIIIHNLETEKTASSLELGNPKAFACIPPRHECRFSPVNWNDLVVHSTSGKVRFVVRAYPS